MECRNSMMNLIMIVMFIWCSLLTVGLIYCIKALMDLDLELLTHLMNHEECFFCFFDDEGEVNGSIQVKQIVKNLKNNSINLTNKE